MSGGRRETQLSEGRGLPKKTQKGAVTSVRDRHCSPRKKADFRKERRQAYGGKSHRMSSMFEGGEVSAVRRLRGVPL